MTSMLALLTQEAAAYKKWFEDRYWPMCPWEWGWYFCLYEDSKRWFKNHPDPNVLRTGEKHETRKRQ